MKIGAVTLALMAWLFVTAALAEPVRAETPIPTPDEAQALIKAVLSGEDFGSTREQETWVYIGGSADGERGKDDTTDGLPIEFILTIASALKWLLGIATAAALLLLAYRLWLELRGLRVGQRGPRAGPEPRHAAPTSISDDATTLAPLPADITAAVHALLARNDARGALSLLYRAQIAHLRASGLDIHDSATEADCLDAAARAAAPAELAWLRGLTQLWLRVAYAHQAADPAQIGQLLATHPAVVGTTEAG
ncbi:MAG: DUF4129 domain-containing protein [Thiohalocapsa sp.]